jgi:CHRD domain
MVRKALVRLAVIVALMLGLAVPAFAEIVTFEVALSGANQVPPADTAGNGLLVAQFDTDTRLLSWTVTYSGLTGAPTAAHFHGPAELGINAGVTVGLQGDLTSPINGEAVLTAEQAADLLAGLLYLNIHTAAFPAGEIRGQLVLPQN